MILKRIAPIALALAALAAACGSNDGVNQYQPGASGSGSTEENSGNATAENSGPRDHLVQPPQEYYDALFANALRMVDAPQGLALLDANAAQTLWVNFDGASIRKGFELGQSFLLCQDMTDFPAASASAADRAAILAQVQKFFADAGANLNVTSAKPASGNYTTIHVGGAYQNLGCSGSGVLGIAPFDQGNANKADVGFAFTEGVSNIKTIAETIAHEAGHTFGLDHTSDLKDLMYASSTNQITGFLAAKLAAGSATQDGPVLLQKALGLLSGAVASTASTIGAATAAAPVTIPGISILPASLASLPGLGQIAMIGQLLASIQNASVADISTLLPQITALLPASVKGVSLGGLDKILTVIGVAASAQASQSGQALPTSLAGIFNSGLVQGILNPSNAGAISGLAGLASLAGFGNIGLAVSAVQGILSIVSPATTSSTATTPAAIAAQLPDFGSIIGLVAKDKNYGALITNMLGTAEIISKNFTGTDKDALLSLIKVAYAQLYGQVTKLP